ncbi:MAG: hypothetical protein BWZ05_01849 [Bacteroidetes bacterium ADurb.BinA245]|nr:MAG: hypothetical protein BWZ05_01849 [Bacteroidetes bacterium ADurb.BinA245]
MPLNLSLSEMITEPILLSAIMRKASATEVSEETEINALFFLASNAATVVIFFGFLKVTVKKSKSKNFLSRNSAHRFILSFLFDFVFYYLS